MARLQDLRQSFTALVWQDKVKFIEEYRTKRYNDLHTIQDFDLSRQKTKVPKVAKEKTVKKVKQIKQFNSEQLALLKQLGLI